MGAGRPRVLRRAQDFAGRQDAGAVPRAAPRRRGLPGARGRDAPGLSRPLHEAALTSEEPLEEARDAFACLDDAVLGLLPGALGLGLGVLGRLLHFFPGDPGAFDHGVADTLGRLLHTLADLLGAGLDLLLGLVDLARVRSPPGYDGAAQQQQHGGAHHEEPLLMSAHRFPPFGASRLAAGRPAHDLYSISAIREPR